MIKNIFFDLDDTILDFHKAERTALTKALIQLGVEPTDKILDRYHEINIEQWKLLELGKISRNDVKVRRYEKLFEEFNIKLSAEETTEIYEKLLEIGHYFISGAEEILENLHGKCRLYIVSNGAKSVQDSRIKSAGIAKYFDNIFISEVIGAEKPSKMFFDACFSQIPQFEKNEAVIVGDSLSSDIRGGANANIATVWFNPNGKVNDTNVIPDYKIHSLRELENLPLLNAELTV